MRKLIRTGGFVVLAVGLMAFGGALAQYPAGQSAQFVLGFFLPSALIAGAGSLLVWVTEN